jgi:hypothetical protein
MRSGRRGGADGGTMNRAGLNRRRGETMEPGESAPLNARRRKLAIVLALAAIPILLAYASIDDALAGAPTGHRSGSQSRAIQSRPGHSISPRHRAREPNHSDETYRSLLRHSNSEWNRARAARD